MIEINNKTTRRKHLKRLGLITSGLFALPSLGKAKENDSLDNNDLNIIGPRKGFSPQVGTLVSMMNFMRDIVLRSVRNLGVRDLDYLHDDNSNSIGAMLLHLAAIERAYQRSTFEGEQWTGLSGNEDRLWNAAADLGDTGRTYLKGFGLDFYLNALAEVRAFSIAEMKKRDDDWLMTRSYFWGGQGNNYAKWFHVVEHESNHNGQIKYIKSRLHTRS